MTKQNMLKASKLDFHICIIFLGSQVNFVKINRSFTLTYQFLGVEDFLSKLMKIFSLFALEYMESLIGKKCIFVIHKLYFVGYLSDNDDICQLIYTGLFKQAGW